MDAARGLPTYEAQWPTESLSHSTGEVGYIRFPFALGLQNLLVYSKIGPGEGASVASMVPPIGRMWWPLLWDDSR